MSDSHHSISKVSEYLQALINSRRLGTQVVYQSTLPENPAIWSETSTKWPSEIEKALRSMGIRALYQHQARAIDLIRNQRHVIVATPTASGKTLIYNLPVLERFQKDNNSKSLYVFPLKALAQDQLRVFDQMAAHFGETRPTAAIYDGDTSAYRRKRIREAPTNVILTNPEMLHLSFLAHHRKWSAFFQGLQTVVVDEVHTYRGVMGSHVAQFFMRNPQDFINREPEAAVVNPYNPQILAQHLECAAAELPLKIDEPPASKKYAVKTVQQLEKIGKLLRSADGRELYAQRKNPHRYVNIRGSGHRFQIVASHSGQNMGEIDEFRAYRETHRGAIYLHRGDTYIVDTLDFNAGTISVSEAEVDYFTQVRGYKVTEILEIYEQKPVWGAMAATGRLKVTDHVTEYEIRRIHGKKLIKKVCLDLPPQIFETEGLWFKIPQEIVYAAESEHLDFMGGIHAVEHAAIGIFPLLVMADRNDLGGLSTPYHPQLNSAAIFVYDGIAGGVGLNREAYKHAERLLAHTLNAIQGCACESGCPSCVHSPKCGSANRPIDKAAAIFKLNQLKQMTVANPAPAPGIIKPQKPFAATGKKPSEALHYGVFDLETQRSAAEVGGWQRADLMKISCVVLYDSREGRFIDFMENQIPRFIECLQAFDLVVGFNIKRFDYQVLKGYSDFNFMRLNSLDILEEVKNYLGFRLSLAHLATITLGADKSADGLQALQWWKQGRMLEIIEYCRQDVKLTRDLFWYGRKNGHLVFKNKAGKNVRIPVIW